jgi:hypothetical protein
MSFDTEAELDLTLSERSLRQVKQRISGELGATKVGVTDGGTMSAQAASGGGRGRRRERQSYRLEQSRTELLDEAVGYLEEIDDKVETLGGGGGGLTNELIATTVETGGDAAIEGGSILADLGIDTLGTTVGSAVGNAISGSSLSVEKPGWVPLAVEAVEPLDVEQPQAVGFESPPGPVGFEELPGPVGFSDLPGPVGFEPLPDPVGFESLPGPVTVEDVDPIAVEDVDPIPVEVSVSTTSTQTTTGGSSSSSAGNSGTGGVQVGGKYGITLGPGGVQIGGDNGITLGKDPGDPTGAKSGDSSGSGSNTGGTQPVSVNVDVDNRNRITVETTTDEVVDGVMAEVEKEYGDAIDDLEADLQEALSDIDSLENAIGGRR